MHKKGRIFTGKTPTLFVKKRQIPNNADQMKKFFEKKPHFCVRDPGLTRPARFGIITAEKTEDCT